MTASASLYVRLPALAAGLALCLPIAAKETPPKPAPKPPPQIERILPSYTIGEDERDPFFSLANQGQDKEPETPPEPTAAELFAALRIVGLLGEADRPERAGVMIGKEIYRVGQSIPVNVDDTTYAVKLVAVDFPAEVVLSYEGKSATITVGAADNNEQNGD
jgi:hypothetical protein